ncbi:dihydroflavonol-4-reductase [Sphingosinicella soli]|uniref:Dihydroflavonol-4-reductase n=1 Tax=Sphingosinicella soli TaxID=333708 RepID=A0A7W7B296_9SPHN|nr:dihydroflavonol-4-reductase [Sphingosinicella soli]
MQKLVAAGRPVRVFVRSTSNLERIDHLPIEIVRGDAFDVDAVTEAMQGCDAVYHCIVDTRAWLRDAAPLYRTNIDALVVAMEAALRSDVGRFLFASTVVTIGRRKGRAATEEDAFDWWDDAIDYVKSRVLAEQTFMDYCRERGLPGVALCITNTYGPQDIEPTPQGRMIAMAAAGQLKVYYDGGFPSVGIEDVADGMILAETRGRIGERYILSERTLTWRDLLETAARQAGRTAPLRRVPLPLLYAGAAIAETAAKLRGRDSQLSVKSIRISRSIGDLSSEKARRELGWTPEPVHNAIRRAADFYEARRMAGERKNG